MMKTLSENNFVEYNVRLSNFSGRKNGLNDGGCTCAGDVAKAFGAGADFVMAGGMFSGHDQCDGDVIEKNGKKYKLFYGMSSSTAMEKHAGGIAEYRSSEGKTVEVPYKGNVECTVLDILGGLRSACTYTGADDWGLIGFSDDCTGDFAACNQVHEKSRAGENFYHNLSYIPRFVNYL
ncbi:unnamed protein product [Brassicogethes aeneus]|uniref:GMP reductase n=1 Tax=Brassicogethes aeneus TaxID=1431903 RepID=A0A9P0FDA7_BRAAE|nr:unnamed protein product [Brassicogethes aeneus]